MRGNVPLRVWLIGCKASELLAVRAFRAVRLRVSGMHGGLCDNGITATAFGVRGQRDLLPVAE